MGGGGGKATVHWAAMVEGRLARRAVVRLHRAAMEEGRLARRAVARLHRAAMEGSG